MTNKHFLIAISPPYRALTILILLIGSLWPLMFIQHFIRYQGIPPLDLLIVFLFALFMASIKIQFEKTEIKLSFFSITFLKQKSFMFTTRQDGKFHRVFSKNPNSKKLTSTYFLLNQIPIELVEYKNA